MRRLVVGWCAALCAAALGCGCSESSSGDGAASPDNAATLLGGKNADYRNEAEQLLHDMIAAYAKAD